MTELMQASATVVLWYRRDDYKRVLDVMTDAHLLPPTFDKWLHIAEQVIESSKRQGLLPVKAHIEPEPFPDWCRKRGLDIDATGRMESEGYVANTSLLES